MWSIHPPPAAPPIGFHCRYSSLLTSTQLNISFETSQMNDVATFDISQNILADQHIGAIENHHKKLKKPMLIFFSAFSPKVNFMSIF